MFSWCLFLSLHFFCLLSLDMIWIWQPSWDPLISPCICRQYRICLWNKIVCYVYICIFIIYFKNKFVLTMDGLIWIMCFPTSKKVRLLRHFILYVFCVHWRLKKLPNIWSKVITLFFVIYIHKYIYSAFGSC